MKIFITVTCFFALCISSFAQTKDRNFTFQDENFIKDSSQLFFELRKLIIEDQEVRRLKNKSKKYELVGKLSTDNTKRLIEILNKYGYPSPYRFDSNSRNHLPVFVLFDHADLTYSDTLKKLLLNELELKRMSKNDYSLIYWHLNGRIGVPDITGVKIKESRKLKRKNRKKNISNKQ